MAHPAARSGRMALPDADPVTPQRFSWTGPSWTLSDYLRAATAVHHLGARTRARRWITTPHRPATQRLAPASAPTTSSHLANTEEKDKFNAFMINTVLPSLPM